ncbi:hypothetical protein TRV_06406 [Trichophyton verrucosum HKI 0517]|uniref:ATP-grasp domain-containing protein n=1 Tax=Trichophyton verrucosum (strain HKI 0517) TaxID=663202 RepID=D4DGV1_TRIVH|nr:uncharacterized protein TRV_06406 [Trichophyton verrucosum HKI 0517]EFE38887.1 hypothetical protein TRV_06406 [Trichophyton verrucosum HKI 0517]
MTALQKIQVRSKRDDYIIFYHSASSNINIPLDNFDDIYVLSDCANSSQEILSECLGSTKALQFILQCLLTTVTSQGHMCLAKLIFPLQEGYIVRSDIVPLRLRDYQHVETAVSFAEPLRIFEKSVALDGDKINSLSELFSAAAAGLILNLNLECEENMGLEAISLLVESELENRLSLSWILPGTTHRKTLVLVDANTDHPDRGGTGSGFYLAAMEVGVNIVVMDNAGHWLQGPDYAHWREAFIPTRLTNPVEENLADHITESLRAYGKPVDGIVTFADTYWPYIAKVAQQFGLPTCAPEGFKIATNKYLTSKFVGHNAHLACSVDEALDIANKQDLQYPLIVKPCDGWSSEGVSRVDSQEALALAIKSIDASRHGTEFVMEPYCSGPEFDANFVLLDGEVLFSEICDDLPRSADINGSNGRIITNFHELDIVYPSALPSLEKDEIKSAFLDTLLKLGLKNGIMHLEGRVENSSVEYTSMDGALELTPVDGKSINRKPNPWLIEINPRPPGMTASQITESTYGIEYWAIAVLSAVGDKARVRALSQPFKHGAQYTSVMVFVPADYPSTCEGIFDSDDICADLIARRPDLAKNISRCACFIKRGQKVPHPNSGQNTFMAYFNVFSRLGRKEALDIARQVRKEIHYSFI